MATYRADRRQFVVMAMHTQAEYELQQRPQRWSNLTIGLIVGTIGGTAVDSVSGDAGIGALEGGLAETDHDPVTISRKIANRCMTNHG